MTNSGDSVPAEPRLRFLLARAHALTQLRDLERAGGDLETAMEVATAAGDDRGRARVLLGRGDLEQKGGDFESSMTTLGEALAKLIVQGRVLKSSNGYRLAGRQQPVPVPLTL